MIVAIYPLWVFKFESFICMLRLEKVLYVVNLTHHKARSNLKNFWLREHRM